MPNWYTISGRVTEEEREIIQKFENKTKMSDNQLVRAGISMIVGLGEMTELFSTPNLAILKDYSNEIQRTLNSPKIQKELEKAGERWMSQYRGEQLKKLEEEAKKIQSELSVFDKKRTRGPKPKQQKRGRPAIKD